MLQQINLYNAYPKPAKYDITIRQLFWGCFAIAFFLLLVLCFKGLSMLWQEYELVSLQKKQQVILSNITELRSQHPEFLKINHLETENERLNNDIKSKTLFLEQLNQVTTEQKHYDYATYLDGLAQSIVPDVWIRNIKIVGDGSVIEIEGSATSPNEIMLFLQNLSSNKTFFDKKFTIVQMQSPVQKDQNLNFLISTRQKEPAK